MKQLIFTIATFVFSSGAWADSEFISVKNLNKHLKTANAQWVAKDTWLNHLSKNELVRMMGAKGVNPKGIDFSTERRRKIVNEVWDWRNVNGQNFVSPVLNQGNCGSCVAFAAVGTLETAMNIRAGVANMNPRYSAEALFACGGGGCDIGWWPSSAAAYLARSGVPDEACAPYTMGATGRDVSCSTACRDSRTRSQKISSSTSPSGMDAVKRALKQGPMMTTLMVYADFITYSNGVYKHSQGDMLGGHAVSLIGFDDTKRAWIIRNSWGTDWGMSGFAYVSYDDISGIAEDNDMLQVDQPVNAMWTDMRDRAFISGETDIAVYSKQSETAAVSLEVVDSSGSQKSRMACQSAACTMQLDTAGLSNGKYTLVASKGAAKMYRYFYVSNRAENYSIQMQPLGFNPSRPVSDRIEFQLSLSSNSVPFKRVALVFQNAAGAITERWTDNVAEDMSLGWRTPAVPNGAYTVWIRGEAFANGQTSVIESSKLALNVRN